MLQEGGAYAFRRMQAGATATGNGNSMSPLSVTSGSYSLLTAQVVGITSATITWEGTIDEENWVALPALNVATRAISTTTTANGIYRLVVTSLVAVRARVSTYGAGTIYVYGLLTAAGEPGFGATPTGGGVTDHALLDNLDFASSGHTGFEAEGTAAAAIVTHVGLSDPHTQYLLESTFVPTGSDTQVLFNDGGAWGADAGLTYAKATDRLTVAGGLVTPSMRPASNGTAALQLQDASGTALLTLDTTNGQIVTSAPFRIGGASVADAGDSAIYVRRIQASAFTGARYGVVNYSEYQSNSNTTGRIYGGFYRAGTGTGWSGNITAATNGVVAANFLVAVNGTGAVTNARNIYVASSNGASATITTLDSIYIEKPSGAATIGSHYALRIEDVNVATTNNYAIYTNAGLVRFGDRVILAASTTSRASMTVTAGTAPTTPNDGDMWNDGNAYALMVNGTNAVNTDGGLSVWMQSSLYARNVGRLLWQYTDKTDATRKSMGSLTAYDASTEYAAIRWGANGEALLSFYNVTTPIARQLLATGAGATVDDVITALQNLGLVKQS